MTKLETEFTEKVLKNLSEAESLTGVSEPRLAEQCRKKGAPAALKELLSRGQMTRQFEPLKKAGRLDLTPEYLATRGKYGDLFTDEEVDLCLQALLDAGFFDVDKFS